MVKYFFVIYNIFMCAVRGWSLFGGWDTTEGECGGGPLAGWVYSSVLYPALYRLYSCTVHMSRSGVPAVLTTGPALRNTHAAAGDTGRGRGDHTH